VCLFGRPDADPAHAADPVCASAAWRAVRGWLDTDVGAARFHRDHGAWSVFEAVNSQHKVIAEARKRMAALPGAALVLRGLTAFEPTRRLSMRQLLRAELFAPYRAPYVAPSAGARRPERTMSFLGYRDAARDGAGEAGGALQLPPKPKPAAAQRGKRGGR
jgi:hypothetical protein